jgi:hypothetical protein
VLALRACASRAYIRAQKPRAGPASPASPASSPPLAIRESRMTGAIPRYPTDPLLDARSIVRSIGGKGGDTLDAALILIAGAAYIWAWDKARNTLK